MNVLLNFFFAQNVSLPKYICYPCLDNLRRTYYFQRKLRRLTHPKQPTNFQKIKAGEKLKENYTVKQQEFDDYVDDDRSRESGNSSNGNDNEHRPFKCDICGRGFKVKENFESHHNRHSRKREQFRCTECGLQFLVLAQFDRHTCKKN